MQRLGFQVFLTHSFVVYRSDEGERLFRHSCSECYLVGRTDLDFVCGAIVAKPLGKFGAAMGLLVGSSQHTPLLSQFDECHERQTCCFTAYS